MDILFQNNGKEVKQNNNYLAPIVADQSERTSGLLRPALCFTGLPFYSLILYLWRESSNLSLSPHVFHQEVNIDTIPFFS